MTGRLLRSSTAGVHTLSRRQSSPGWPSSQSKSHAIRSAAHPARTAAGRPARSSSTRGPASTASLARAAGSGRPRSRAAIRNTFERVDAVPRTYPRTLPAEVSTIAFVGVVMAALHPLGRIAPSATPGTPPAIVATAETPASFVAPEMNSRRDVSLMIPPIHDIPHRMHK